jgi:hypothetical protein
VQVDEAGSDDEAGRVDYAVGRGFGEVPDRHDLVPADRDVGAVQDLEVAVAVLDGARLQQQLVLRDRFQVGH